MRNAKRPPLLPVPSSSLFRVAHRWRRSVRPLSGPDSAAATEQRHWFPERQLFPRRVADGQTPQMSLSKDLDSKRIVGSIGGIQRFYETTLAGMPLQVGIGATVYGNFIRKPDVLDVVTVDFFVDFPVDLKISDAFAIRTGWGHYSAHLADDGIEALNLHSINYAKDYIPLVAAYFIPEIRGFVYGGFRFDYFTIPAYGKHWVLQIGSEFARIPLSTDLEAYAAIDIKARQEVNFASTRSFQVGVRTAMLGAHDVRFAYTYRTGAEERGQFYTQQITASLLGVFLDF